LLGKQRPQLFEGSVNETATTNGQRRGPRILAILHTSPHYN
jgi:hypothetical protein